MSAHEPALLGSDHVLFLTFIPQQLLNEKEKVMKALFVRTSTAALLLASMAAPVLAGHVADFQVLGKGTVVNDCSPLVPVFTCNIVLKGQASGTNIDHDEFDLNLRVTDASHSESNGGGGMCVVVRGHLTLTPPTINTPIAINVSGTVCEEETIDTPAHFDGTYRIADGGARLAGRSGAGSLTATYIRGPGGAVYLHLHGTIDP
jgi:hypothetical protein